MKTAEHTPGPWKYIEGEGFIETEMPDFHGTHEHICDFRGDLSGQVSDANARMIAAAPDLLAALQSLLFACRDGAVLPRDAAHAQARAAIAKATGKEV